MHFFVFITFHSEFSVPQLSWEYKKCMINCSCKHQQTVIISEWRCLQPGCSSLKAFMVLLCFTVNFLLNRIIICHIFVTVLTTPTVYGHIYFLCSIFTAFNLCQTWPEPYQYHNRRWCLDYCKGKSSSDSLHRHVQWLLNKSFSISSKSEILCNRIINWVWPGREPHLQHFYTERKAADWEENPPQ